jgi:hypothetical protein
MGGLAAASIAGVLLVTLVHFSAWAHPLLERFAGSASEAQPFPLRRLDPTLRLRGWRDLAMQVDQLRWRLRAQNEDPILAANNWSIPGLLGFYCEDHPAVYSLGPAFGDRKSQYDFWRPNPLGDPSAFAKRTFIIISATAPDLSAAFDSVEVHHVFSRMETGEAVAEWVILVCRGYRGLRAATTNHRF